MAKKVQLMTNPKQWQVVDGVEVLVDVPQEDLDPITDSSCVEIEGHRTLEETINQENMFTPEIVETKVHSKVGGVYHDNVVDGAYEEAILYGNTQVNLVESVTSGSKYIPHSFTSFQGNESKIGSNYHSGRTNQVAPLVKGVTMVNLVQTTSSSVTSGSGIWVNNIKPSTKYTLSLTYTVQNSRKGLIIQSYNDATHLENSKQITSLETNVQLTFTTHANANAIRICNAEGYGGETIQLDNIMVIEGDVTDLDLPFFKGMRSVELSRPLTNLFTDDLVPEVMGVTVTNSGDTVTVTSTTISQWASARYHLDLKPNTKYVIMWDGLTFTQTAGGIDYIISVCENDTIFTHMGNKFTTLRSIVFDTGDKNAISIRIHATTSNSETGTTTVKGLRVFEWDDSLRTLDLQTIGYFSGTKYVSVRALETESKNLYPYGDINFTNDYAGWCDAKGKIDMYGDIARESSARFLLKKGTYTFSCGETTNTTFLALVDDKEQSHGSSKSGERTFTLSQDTYLTLRLKTTEANVATTAKNIQIERGETATAYEAYQSRYYKPRETEEIILRSLPNGVCDTFNLQTGEFVQRIGEIVLDENESWSQDITASESTPNTNIFYTAKHEDFKPLATAQRESGLLCDKMKVIASLFSLDVVGVMTNLDPRAYIRLPKNVAPDVTSLKTYLQSNPVTVQYELAEPVITKLQTYDRAYNGQTNGLVSMSNNLSALTYYSNNYYLKVGNLSPVPAILEPITIIPYDVRLKPSTLYTVKYNRGGNSNSMKFDLGGSVVEKTNVITNTNGITEELTVRTPAILSHEQLILSGTGYAYNFIIAEGDITGTELPYFEGMKNVKMPIVKNVGKNLFDIQSIYKELKNISPNHVSLSNDNTLQIKSTNVWHQKDLGKPIKFKENTRYTLSFNAQDINNFGGLPDIIICFVYTDGTTSYSRTWGNNVSTSTAGKTVDYINFSFGHGDGRAAEFSNFMLVEGTEAQPYEPYKENSVYAVQGEIPFSEDMFGQGNVINYSNGVGQDFIVDANNDKRICLKSLLRVKIGTTYMICTDSNYQVQTYSYTIDNKVPTIPYATDWSQESVFVAQDNKLLITIRKKDDSTITPSAFSSSGLQLFELDSTINLRSLPNGVKDELNLLTGEYIQRVGEVVLDGSEDEGWQVAPSYTGGAARMETLIITGLFPNTVEYNIPNIVNNRYNVHSFTNIYQGRVSNAIGVYTNTHIVVQDNEYTNVDAFKQYLQSNPLTVQYELAEPIISHVRLVSNNQEREVGVKLQNGVCNTYNPSTGITTVRVGKVVLDGSEEYELYETCSLTTVWYTSNPLPNVMNFSENTSVVAEGINAPHPTEGLHNQTKEVCYISNTGRFNFTLFNAKASTVEELKTYLASNPITVWYELKYPQIQPDIVLPNGVHDEYNPETGMYTKKVGFIEFDGSGDWAAGLSSGELQQVTNGAIDMYGVWTEQPLPNARPASDAEVKIPGVCDTFSFKNAQLDKINEEFYFISTTGRFNMNIAKTKLAGSNVSHLKTYLSQNPIKLWYELETPITYQLTPYFGLPQPYAYEDGYLIHESAYAETTLPPEFKYKLIANRTGQVMQNNRKLQQHTSRLSNLEALIIEATIESLFNRELQLFELELMDIQLIDLGE